MATDLYDQACKLQKMFPDWKFTSIVQKLNRSQFSPNSFQNLVQSKMKKKRKHADNDKDMRKKICTVQGSSNATLSNTVDLTTTDDNVIVLSSSEDSTDSSSESSVILDDIININLIKENLLSIFPECAPLYIEFLITVAKDSITNENTLIDHIVSRLISENYPKLENNNTPSVPDIIDNNKIFSVPDLVKVENSSIIQHNDSPNEIKQEVVDTISTDFEELSDNDFNDMLNENAEIETDFFKLFSELEKLLPVQNSFNQKSNIDETKSTVEEIKPIVEHQKIQETVSYKPSTENITSSIETEKLEKMSEMEKDVNAEKLVLKIIPIFPDACPNYLRLFCKGRRDNAIELEEIIMQLISLGDLPKRAVVQRENLAEQEIVDEEKQYQIMLELLPDADPDYLRVHCSNLYDKPDNLKRFIDEAIVHKNYPTLKDYKRKQQLSAQMKQYTTEFNVDKFLESIPNPVEYFNDPKRVCTYNVSNNFNYQKVIAIEAHMKDVFKNLFVNKRIADINYAIKKNQKRVLLTYNELKNGKIEDMKRPRKVAPLQQLYGEIDVPYMQEIAYVTHYDEIHNELKKREQEKKNLFEIAKANGKLFTCECCYDDEVMEEDTYTCDYGHTFCKSCIIRSVEISFGENKLLFTCLTSCNAEFSLITLQKVLKPNMFSKIALRKQIEEVKSAGIEDLESCPFCDFATIPTPGDKIFKCLNDECLKESCRNCKELSHIPYRCDEIEKNDEVKARTYIEDKMTEALLRKCWKCGMKFIKEDGCNKMTCRCGAFMCYVCGKPVDGYKHFNGQGGTNYELCPLYSDTEKLHLDAVRKIGEEAKQEIKQKNPSVQIKYDPLTGLPKAKKNDTVYQPGPLYNPHQAQLDGQGQHQFPQVNLQRNNANVNNRYNNHHHPNNPRLLQHLHHQVDDILRMVNRIPQHRRNN